MSIWTFNTKDGYVEAILRGYRQSLLTPEDYHRLGLSNSLDDLRSSLEETDYGSFLQDEPSPIAVTTIASKCRNKMADEFRYLRSLANQPLLRFLDFIVAEKMIDNVVSLIQGAANKKSPEELLSRIDPLGWFPEMRAIAAVDTSTGYEDMYRMLLIDTPVGPYFEAYLHSQAADDALAGARIGSLLTEQDMELMRSALKKTWLEDFYSFCTKLGGTTATVMQHILMCEADFRVLSVTLNTINTPLGSSARLQDRNALYPSFGYLYPDGTDRIRKAWNDVTVRAALEPFPKYLTLYDECKDYYIRDEGTAATNGTTTATAQPSEATSSRRPRGTGGGIDGAHLRSLEDLVFAESVGMCELAFEEQFHYGIYYAWVKLKEQEIRNIVWIADMILMDRKDQLDQILPIFQPRG